MEEIAPGGGVYFYIVAAGLDADVDGAAIDAREGVGSQDLGGGALGGGAAFLE
jgi:hypothetical protein